MKLMVVLIELKGGRRGEFSESGARETEVVRAAVIAAVDVCLPVAVLA